MTEPITLSNSIRLTGRQWLAVAVFAVLFAWFAPLMWKQIEDFPLEDDYRIPRQLKEDYWLYQRFAQRSAPRYDGFVIGDSVVWGQYAKRSETLSHYLNERAGRERFVNFGMNGAHPLALEGLIRHYGGAICAKDVVLHCNLLWLSSPKLDLQEKTDEAVEAAVFHASLVPQFVPYIPAYDKQEISPRLGILVQQRLPISQGADHLQQAYYDGKDIPQWTLSHPYANPLEPLTRGLPASDDKLEKPQRPWFKDAKSEAMAPRVSPPWIDMDTSLQWAAFQRVVKLLKSRDNRVFVLVGPFNEHMLPAGSKDRCQEIKATIAAWLTANEIPHMVAEVLPSKEYGDLSHPLPGGYELLAQHLWSMGRWR